MPVSPGVAAISSTRSRPCRVSTITNTTTSLSSARGSALPTTPAARIGPYERCPFGGDADERHRPGGGDRRYERRYRPEVGEPVLQVDADVVGLRGRQHLGGEEARDRRPQAARRAALVPDVPQEVARGHPATRS